MDYTDLTEKMKAGVSTTIPDSENPESQSNIVLSILEDQDGILWFGTISGGLNRFDPAKEIFTQYKNDPNDPHSLSNDIILSLIRDHTGVLWVGTPDGFNKFDQETETFTRYREKDGMANDNVYCMAEDEGGHIWLSTNKGLSRFDPQKEVFRNYDITNGLQSNEFNITSCHVGDRAEMFFGGINGFNVFFPNQIQDNSALPPIILTSLSQDGEQVDLGIAIDQVAEVTFMWPDDSFEFEFAALSYAHSEKNQYAYLLDGFDENWNETGTRRYGKYTNLPGGTYTLRLRGSNNDGIWNEDGAALKVTIVPPFWANRWFQGIILLILVGGIYYGYRLRLRNLETRGRELEIQVKDRTDELMKAHAALRETDLERAVIEERNRLARELHDSVTQSLYSLTLFTEAARHLSEATGDEKLEGYLGQIGSLGLQALKEMRLLVFELGLHALAEDDLVEALEKRLKAVENRTGVDAKIINEGYQKQPPYIETQLFRIAQEALNNALKHAGASSVEVHFQQEGNTLEMEIIDDGIGFEPESIKRWTGHGIEKHQRQSESNGWEARNKLWAWQGHPFESYHQD